MTLAALFVILSPYTPRLIVVLSIVLGCTVTWFYPALPSSFPDAGIFATAILASHFAWAAYGLGCLGLFAHLGMATWLRAFDGGLDGLVETTFGLLVASILGLSAGVVEQRIRAEISHRVAVSREHDRRLAKLRLKFSLDTHDAVSHSLSTESSIIKMLSREQTTEAVDRKLAELTLVNSTAQKRLRTLLSSLDAESPDKKDVDFDSEIRTLGSAIRAASAAGGMYLSVTSCDLPRSAQHALMDHARSIIMELTTNIIRYTTLPDTPVIAVSLVGRQPGSAQLCFESCNRSQVALPAPPRSLSRRAQALNGDCQTSYKDDGTLQIVVKIPVNLTHSHEKTQVAEHVSLRDEENHLHWSEHHALNHDDAHTAEPGRVGQQGR
ncbi:hypothetical protein [Brevibacterium spongiae]|uniref:Signal transduction histidine kinase subgroup 3 dimerisation and phosphoacceptor domain-containing protein n=1 Tax=Brevibacterium spongiae TaxID=2909672 RepID=A0ABY5SPZ6_9MICO|nr:hypothetical protein [Brevibacterium spongiae]UVI36254.1 hypothetical protein L1F31_00900 [Brevibacterium spongiae]